MISSHAKAFFVNKALSILLTLLILGLVVFFFPGQAQWNVLILLLIFFGQGHFIISYIYQFNSIGRKVPSMHSRMVFSVMLLVLVAILAYLYFELGLNEWALVFIGAYFIVHNMLNEQTMWGQSNRLHAIPYGFTISLILVLLGTYFLSTAHPDFSFALSKHEIYRTSIFLEMTFEDNSRLIPTFLPFICYFLGVLLFFWQWVCGKISRMQTSFWSLFFALLLFLTVSKIALDFLHLMAFIIIYHYVTWFIYYLGKTTSKGPLLSTRRSYLLISASIYALLFIIFIAGNLTVHFLANTLYVILFSLNYFVIWTFMHISATLINETPILNLLNRN